MPPSLCGLARRLGLVLAVALALAPAGCSGAGRFLQDLFRERPPVPLDSLSLASDARVDSAGALAGSFVGEGTPRAIHLLSSDTLFIRSLLRRFRPDLEGTDPWAALGARRFVTLAPASGRRTVAGAPVVESAVVGSPLGHTDVRVEAVVLHGGRHGCGARGAQAELIVADQRRAGDPPLRGPVLGSLRTGAVSPERGLIRRDSVPAPGAGLIGELVGRTGRAIDSTLGPGYPALQLRPDPAALLEINTLADVDAADVIAFRVSGERIRYAVSLRTRRVAARGDTLVAAAVMVWDSAGVWRQDIFRPTLLRLRGGRLEPWGARGRPIYWRRLQPISDFAFARDELWLEQVDVQSGTVRWGIVQPTDNVVTASAEVDGPCR